MHIPDADIALPDMVADHASDNKNSGKLEKSVLEMISPYPNVSTFWFGNWFWNGSYKKSTSAKLQVSFHLFGLFCAFPVATQAYKSQQVRLSFSICEL